MPGSTGVYSILEQGVNTADAEFAKIYDEARGLKKKNGTLAPPPAGSVGVAVLDSGVISAGDPYFSARMAESGSALGGMGVQLTRGLPTTTGQHGAHVASIASSGTTMIKILDVQVGSTQEGGNVKLEVWATAFKWAIEQRARIVNVSIVCPWSNPSISGLVEQNTGTLFLATSGNANIEFTQQYRTENGFDQGNVILVGGCGRDGNREDQRGFGSGIDIFVPSFDVPGYTSYQFAQQQNYERERKRLQSEDAKLNPDRARLATLKEQLEKNPTDVALQRKVATEEGRLKRGIARLPVLPASPTQFQIDPAYQQIMDSGVSFGIPMVANVAAKMMLIFPNFTPKEVIALMKSTAEACGAGPVLDPVRCYQAALEKRREWVARL